MTYMLYKFLEGPGFFLQFGQEQQHHRIQHQHHHAQWSMAMKIVMMELYCMTLLAGSPQAAPIPIQGRKGYNISEFWR